MTRLQSKPSHANRIDLCAIWQEHFKSPPPKGLGSGLMERIIAFETQAKDCGGLDVDTRKLLRSVQTQIKGNTADRAKTLRNTPTAGAKLMREWNGVTHVVEVLDDGYLWQGQSCKSLSKIAKLITGAHWSGPRFFGLTEKRRKSKTGDALAIDTDEVISNVDCWRSASNNIRKEIATEAHA